MPHLIYFKQFFDVLLDKGLLKLRPDLVHGKNELPVPCAPCEAWLRNLLDEATKSSELIGEGGRGGGQSRKSKVRSEISPLDFRASEMDI